MANRTSRSARVLLCLALVASVALGAPRHALAQQRARAPGALMIVSESGWRVYSVTVRRAGRTVADCQTPCALRLAPGRYALLARADQRVLASSVDVGERARWVRLGATDVVQSLTGMLLTMLGVGASVLATDNMTYLASPMEWAARPWATTQLVSSVTRDESLMASALLLPAALALLTRGAAVSGGAQERLVVVGDAPRASAGVRFAGVSGGFLPGGAMGGLTLTF